MPTRTGLPLALLALVLSLVTATTTRADDLLLLVPDKAPTIVIADGPDICPAYVQKEGRGNRRQATVADWAEFLAMRLKQATGVEVPIVPASKAPDEGMLILVGTSKLSKRHGFDGSAKDLEPEEVRIAAFDRGVAVYGERLPANARGAMARNVTDLWRPKPEWPDDVLSDRGTGHAVTFFLEKFVGFRFYIPDNDEIGTVVPKVKTVTIPRNTDFRTAPAFPYRFPAGRDRQWDWPVPMEYPATKRGASVELSANHCYDIAPKDFPNRPDLFAKGKDGEILAEHKAGCPPCYASPEYLELYLEHIRYYDKHGKMKYRQRRGSRAIAFPKRVMVGPHDVNWEDYDPRSRKWVDETRGPLGTHSDLLGQFVVKLARRVKREWPDRRVIFMGQNRYAEAPSDRIELPDHVDVLTCMKRSTAMYHLPAYEEYCDTFVEDWSKKLGGDRRRLAIWEYVCWPIQWTKIPVWHPYSEQRFLQKHRDRIAGQFHNGGGAPYHIQFPLYALWAELLWDPDIDIDAWYVEFCDKFFGPAAEPMHELIALGIERYESTTWTESLGWSAIRDKAAYKEIYPPEVVARFERLYERGRELAAKHPDDIYLRRLDYFFNNEGRWGLDAFFKTSKFFHKPRKSPPLVALKVDDDAIVVDGKLDEAAWKAIERLELLEGDDPATMHPAQKWWETYARLAWNDEGLLVAMRGLTEGTPTIARARRMQELVNDDYVAVLIDRGGKKLDPTQVNLGDLNEDAAEQLLARLQGDVYIVVNAAGTCDLPGVETATHRQHGHFTVEMRIPWNALGLDPDNLPAKLKADLRRGIARRRGKHAIPHPRHHAWATSPKRRAPLELSKEGPPVEK